MQKTLLLRKWRINLIIYRPKWSIIAIFLTVLLTANTIVMSLITPSKTLSLSKNHDVWAGGSCTPLRPRSLLCSRQNLRRSLMVLGNTIFILLGSHRSSSLWGTTSGRARERTLMGPANFFTDPRTMEMFRVALALTHVLSKKAVALSESSLIGLFLKVFKESQKPLFRTSRKD